MTKNNSYSLKSSSSNQSDLEHYGSLSITDRIRSRMDYAGNSKFGRAAKFIHGCNKDAVKEVYNAVRGTLPISSEKKKRSGTNKAVAGAVGAITGAIEASSTFSSLSRANDLPFTVLREPDGLLFDTVNKRYLNPLEEKIMYPLANTKIGPIPLSTIVWVGAAAITALGTYYASKKLLDRYSEKK